MSTKEDKDFFMLGVFLNSMRNILSRISKERLNMGSNEISVTLSIIKGLHNILGELDSEEISLRSAFKSLKNKIKTEEECRKNAFMTDQIREAIKYTKWAHACLQRISEKDSALSSVHLDEVNKKWMKELSDKVSNLLFDINY